MYGVEGRFVPLVLQAPSPRDDPRVGLAYT